MGQTQSTRRAILGGVGSYGAVLLSGCATEGDDDDSEPDRTDGAPSDGETKPAEPEIEFRHPDAVRSDEPFDITISGLPTDSEVDVVLETEEWNGTSFEGRATIRTDDGTVSLSEATVISEGDDTTDGVVPGDLDVPLPLALVQFATTSQPIHFYTAPTETRPTYRIETDDEVLGETTLTREFPTYYRGDSIDHPDLVGWVYEPAGDASGPGVLVLHGSEGQPARSVAASIAEHGYTAFALQYFGATGLPETYSEVPLEYVESAAEWLRSYETVTSDEIGVYGFSKGGELALLAASTFDGFGPVVSVAGSGVVFEGHDEMSSTWTHDGEPVPHIPHRGLDSLEVVDEADLQRATIPVENIDGRVLLLSGADDTLWPATALQQIAADRLAEHGHPEFEHVVYDQTGHYFFEPYVPMMGATEHGGELAGCAFASHDHWPNVLETLSSLK